MTSVLFSDFLDQLRPTPCLSMLGFSPGTSRPRSGRKAASSVRLRSNYICERFSKMFTSPRSSEPERVQKNEIVRPRRGRESGGGRGPALQRKQKATETQPMEIRKERHCNQAYSLL